MHTQERAKNSNWIGGWSARRGSVPTCESYAAPGPKYGSPKRLAQTRGLKARLIY
jgi:hypothetical protein